MKKYYQLWIDGINDDVRADEPIETHDLVITDGTVNYRDEDKMDENIRIIFSVTKIKQLKVFIYEEEKP